MNNFNTILHLAVTPPSITAQPTSQIRIKGEEMALSVAAVGKGPLSYQWMKHGEPVTHPLMSGATTPNLYTIAVQIEHEGSYKCVVSNKAGSVDSEVAQLEVGMSL